jgi:hypothetical protein
VPAWRKEFRVFAGFFADTFSEKWSYLPIHQAKIAGSRKILPGSAGDRENSTGHYFPRPRKIDV